MDDVSSMIDESTSIEERIDQRRALDLLDRMLARLSLKLREPLILFEIEGYSQSEIAEALSLPLGTVASRLRRGREKFLRIAAEHNLTSEGIS
jgi:RNA polymerase sigma-70 factor (ECF subfamily)